MPSSDLSSKKMKMKNDVKDSLLVVGFFALEIVVIW